MSAPSPGDACRGVERPAGGAPQSYLAVCGTDRDSDIGSQHDCECRSQFNSESTVEEEGGERQRDILHCHVWDFAADGSLSIHIKHSRTFNSFFQVCSTRKGKENMVITHSLFTTQNRDSMFMRS